MNRTVCHEPIPLYRVPFYVTQAHCYRPLDGVTSRILFAIGLEKASVIPPHNAVVETHVTRQSGLADHLLDECQYDARVNGFRQVGERAIGQRRDFVLGGRIACDKDSGRSTSV